MKGILWTKDSTCAATGGACQIDWSATGISIDSRTTQSGDLFVAIKGPRMDGHDFVEQAFSKGAVAALVDHRLVGIEKQFPVITVNNTKEALDKLGIAARKRSPAQIIAVTGSVGKTGTKDAIYHSLIPQGKTCASAHSYNNHWGVPLSLARMAPDSDYGIFEVGMNHAGEITPLSRMIQPDVSIITTVEPVHIEYFESVEAIADAKAEIFTGMMGGTAILNRDNPYFYRLKLMAEKQGVDQILSFGEHKEADARLISRLADCSGNNVEALICGRRIGYRLGIPGQHLVQNSLAVLLAISTIDADVAKAANSLSNLVPIDGRGLHHKIDIEDGFFTIIDESYNANPASMRAAIETLSTMTPGPCAKRIAVLGDMRELGEKSEDYHIELANTLAEHSIDEIYACGEQMSIMFNALPSELRGGFSNSAIDLGNDVKEKIRPGDIVTVKGSLAIGMKTIVNQLMALKINGGEKTSQVINGTA